MASMTGVATFGDSVALTGVLGVEGGLAKSVVGCPGGLAGKRAARAADEGWSPPVGAGRWSLVGDDSGGCA